jgi:uncharacterized protein YndB with AHSA1/START domain
MENTCSGNRSIDKNLFINATPERVFQALTEKDNLERWFVKEAEVDLRPGGAISFEWDRKAGVFNFGKILVIEPPHLLSYSWQALEPSPTTVTVELTPENDGTYLHLIHSGIGEGKEWGNYYDTRNRGWDIHLKNLTNWLETGASEPHKPGK